jgi:polyisoprenoid-binding protein YceI
MPKPASRLFAASLVAALIAASSLAAQPAAAPAAPRKLPVPVKDYKAAPAGKYTLDQSHLGLVARVSHVGFSWSVFRFTKATGVLTWDPANPAADKLTVTVDPASIATSAVEGFPAELGGEKYLNVAKFPAATFTSRAFHVIDATHGRVDGDLTLLGVTKPVTFDVELVGAGPEFRGPVLGVTARTAIPPNDFGLPGPFWGPPIQLTVDVEFDKAAS